MASRLLTDELWNEIRNFFPERPSSPLGGRPPTDNRTVLTAILLHPRSQAPLGNALAAKLGLANRRYQVNAISRL